MDLQNWQKTETVTLEVSDGAQTQVYRLTFATCSNYDLSLYSRRRQKVFERLTARFGQPVSVSTESKRKGGGRTP